MDSSKYVLSWLCGRRVVNYKGIRIGGISGIHKEYDYYKGHFENTPYTDHSMRSVYHYRQQDIIRLKQISGSIDIMMSHDWPNEVAYYGNAEDLCLHKPHFRVQNVENRLGSPPLLELLNQLKPSYWFSGHLHCKFEAVVPHEGARETKSMRSGKWNQSRSFLQFVEVNEKENTSEELEYDLEWLTILHVTKHLMNVQPRSHRIGISNLRLSNLRSNFVPSSKEILKRFRNDLVIPKNFERTAEVYNPSSPSLQPYQPKPILNPQSSLLCNLFDIDDPLSIVLSMAGEQFVNFRQIDRFQRANTSLQNSDPSTDGIPPSGKRI